MWVAGVFNGENQSMDLGFARYKFWSLVGGIGEKRVLMFNIKPGCCGLPCSSLVSAFAELLIGWDIKPNEDPQLLLG